MSPASCYVASGPGVVVGDVVVDDVDTWGDLSQLAGAWCVTGNLTFKNTPLWSLDQVQSLVAVGNTITIQDNPQLYSLQGFDNLRRALKLSVLRNPQLAELSGAWRLTTLSSIQVYANRQLRDLRGLDNLTTFSWAEIVNNASLTALWGLGNVSSVYGYLDIRQNPKLLDLRGLDAISSVGNMIQVMDNPGLLRLEGLAGLRSVGTLRVQRNAALETIHGLEGLSSARTFQVSDNPKLDACELGELATHVAADCAGCVRNGPCGPRLDLNVEGVGDYSKYNEFPYGVIQPGDTVSLDVTVYNRSSNQAVLSPARITVDDPFVSQVATAPFPGPLSPGARQYAAPWLRLANDVQRGQVIRARVDVDYSAAGQSGTLSRFRDVVVEAESSAYGSVYLATRQLGDNVPENGSGALDGRYLPGEKLLGLVAVQNRIRSPLTIVGMRLQTANPAFIDFQANVEPGSTVGPADTLFMAPTFWIASNATPSNELVHYELDYEQDGQVRTISSAYFWPNVTSP